MTTLYGRSQAEISLYDAIVACQECFGDAVGLFYSPESCCLGKVAKTSVTDSGGEPLKLDRVFEARMFNAGYELRWLNDRGGQGTAVLLSEKAIDEAYLKEPVDPVKAIDTENQTYLLWGEGFTSDKVQTGWSRLATSRLGKLDVPIPGVNKPKQRVKLIAREYFQCMDGLYGNVVVAEERLIGFKPVIN